MGGTVLVIEDDQTVAAFIRDVLEGEGYEVVHAIGAFGLVQARNHQPGVILLDIRMPGMNSVEVSRRLRDDPATAAIPIVCLPSHVSHGTIPPNMHYDDALGKPFDIDDLSAVVTRWMGESIRAGER